MVAPKEAPPSLTADTDLYCLHALQDVNSKYTNAEMISIFCDRILRSGGERLSEEQVEDLLERLVQLFSYISDKVRRVQDPTPPRASRTHELSVAHSHTTAPLSPGLVCPRVPQATVQAPVEPALCLGRCGALLAAEAQAALWSHVHWQDGGHDGRLARWHGPPKVCCPQWRAGWDSCCGGGCWVSSSLHGWFLCTPPTPTHTREFEEYMAREGSKPKFAFKVQVLTTGFWPFYKQLDAVLPPEMQACQKAFQSFYDSKTSHRKLQWVYTLGSATVRCCCFVLGYTACNVQHGPTSLSPLTHPQVKAFFPKDAKDLQVTTLQCVVLLLFNATPGPMAFKTVREAINCDEDVTKRLLHSLSCGKYKVRICTPRLRRWGCLSVEGGRLTRAALVSRLPMCAGATQGASWSHHFAIRLVQVQRQVQVLLPQSAHPNVLPG